MVTKFKFHVGNCGKLVHNPALKRKVDNVLLIDNQYVMIYTTGLFKTCFYLVKNQRGISEGNCGNIDESGTLS